jgi:hypothetical protein
VDFQALIQNDVASATAAAAPRADEAPSAPLAAAPAPVRPPKKPATLKERTRQQSLYLEIPVHDVLREIAFTERTSLHALLLEGVDAVLKKRGAPSIRELLLGSGKTVL